MRTTKRMRYPERDIWGTPQRCMAFVGRGEVKAQMEFSALREMKHCGLCFDEVEGSTHHRYCQGRNRRIVQSLRLYLSLLRKLCGGRHFLVSEQESNQRNRLGGDADREAYRCFRGFVPLLPRLQAALPQVPLSAPIVTLCVVVWFYRRCAKYLPLWGRWPSIARLDGEWRYL